MSTFTEENIDYLKKVVLLDVCSSFGVKKRFAASIINDFVKQGSEKELNISSAARKKCLKKFSKIEVTDKNTFDALDHLFDEIDNEVYENLLCVYYQFKQTNAFNKVRRQIQL